MPGVAVDQPALALRSAVFGHDVPMVGPVSFTVEPGEVVALLGGNGAGKSTLVTGILGVTRCFGGTVEVFGGALTRHRPWLGYVPQHNAVGDTVPVSVREMVESGTLSAGRLSRSQRRRAAAEAMDMADVSALARRPIGALSGGQQRRVMLARALAARPRLLIMDEPTAGVDLAHQEQFALCLGSFARDDVAVVMVAHELGPTASVVTRSIVLEDGQVVFDGPPQRDHVSHSHGSDAHHDDDPLPPSETGLWP